MGVPIRRDFASFIGHSSHVATTGVLQAIDRIGAAKPTTTTIRAASTGVTAINGDDSATDPGPATSLSFLWSGPAAALWFLSVRATGTNGGADDTLTLTAGGFQIATGAIATETKTIEGAVVRYRALGESVSFELTGPSMTDLEIAVTAYGIPLA